MIPVILSPIASLQKASAQEAVRRGSEHLKHRHVESAIQEFKRALSLDPQSASAHMLLGYAYRVQGRYEMIGEAKAELQQALAIDPTLFWARFYLARVYLDLGRLQKSREELEAGLQASSNNPHFLSLLGEVHRQLGRPDLSVEHNRKALEADPALTTAHHHLGLAYIDLEKKAEARREMELALRFDQPLPDTYLALGSLYLEDKILDRAIELFRKAIKLAPARAEAYLQLAKAYRLQGHPDQALEQLRGAEPSQRGVPSSPYFQQLQIDIFFEIGLNKQEAGLTSEAIDAYLKVVEMDRDHGKAHRQLAEVLAARGDYAHAREHAAKAEALGTPLDPELLRKIKSRSP